MNLDMDVIRQKMAEEGIEHMLEDEKVKELLDNLTTSDLPSELLKSQLSGTKNMKTSFIGILDLRVCETIRKFGDDKDQDPDIIYEITKMVTLIKLMREVYDI